MTEVEVGPRYANSEGCEAEKAERNRHAVAGETTAIGEGFGL